MATAEEKRGYDLDFSSIQVFNGKGKSKWFRCIQHTCAYSSRSLHKELLHRSAGAVSTVLLKMEPATKAE